MATLNPFDLLGVDDSEDPLQLLKKIEPKKPVVTTTTTTTKLQSKTNTQTQAVKEGKTGSNQGSRGSGRGYGRERGSGGGGSYRDSNNYGNSYGNRDISTDQRTSNERDDGKPFERRGGYGRPRGGFSNGDSREGDSERPRRPFDRHNGTGRGSDMKREGSGQRNWGTQSDEWTPVTEEAIKKSEKNLNLNAEKPLGEEAVGDKEAPKNETEEEKKPEDKEMTLEEYEKVLEGKRKALQSLKTEGRKVDVKEFESMQQLSNKKASDDIFVKLGSEKDKKKELAEKEERAKKSVSINEFLKPADGERKYSGGRGRGRGRGEPRGGGTERSNVKAPAIEDPCQFPTLGGK